MLIPLKPRAPIVDWGHPVTKGLVFDLPLFERGGTTTLEIINRLAGTIAGSGATWDTNLYGADLDFSAAASQVSFTTPASVNNLGKLSYEFLIYPRSQGGNSLGRLFDKADSGSGAPFYVMANFPASNQLEFNASQASAAGQWTIVMTFNKWYHMVIAYDTGSLNAPIIYLNGVPVTVTQVTAPVGSLGADDTNLRLGNSSAGTRNFDGKMVYCRIWNRMLSGVEAKMLYENPFKIYRRTQLSRGGVYLPM